MYSSLGFPELMVDFFPHRTSKPKEEANIGQLISMKYQRDWLNEQAERKQAKENTKASLLFFYSCHLCLVHHCFLSRLTFHNVLQRKALLKTIWILILNAFLDFHKF